LTSFKLLKGLEINLPEIKVEGTMYFCTDTGNLYIDCQEDEKIVRKLVDKSKFDEINIQFGNVRSEISELSSEVAYIDIEDDEIIEDENIAYVGNTQNDFSIDNIETIT
jgi:DNA-dependent RNA polymerase auxiliary subunit epsilon